MERRGGQRISRRLSCEVSTPDGRASGFVCNVSQAGLFVQTLADPPENSIIELLFQTEVRAEGQKGLDAIGESPELQFEVGVARRVFSPEDLRTSTQTGLGLEVIPPRALFERWIQHQLRAKSNPVTKAPNPPDTTSSGTGIYRAYRYRMIRHDLPGSRTLTIRSDSEATARARALAQIGKEWRIAEVSAL